ncbi:MAG: succinate dehydrogenase assembly factor 2 [Halofilum sp. (in: g-proteobacteria)]|nr:succinate dehydrogenase assembly factor 2 [Halofilum sp. (in: g-proteobacteria)]
MGNTVEPAERARLRWLCRRGTRELDLLLTDFLEHRWAEAPPSVRAAFERLLTMQDPELYALLTGRAQPDDPELADVIARIRPRPPA